MLQLLHGSNLEVLPSLPCEGFTALVTDPPSGKNFMSLEWETSTKRDFCKNLERVFRLCFPLLIPGSWACVWAHASTSHWTAVALEEAGFCIVQKIIHLNAEARPPSPTLLAPGHEEWILAYKPGPKKFLNLNFWKRGPRHPRTVLIGDSFAKELDNIIGCRKSGAYSGKRSPDKNRHSLGSFKGTQEGKSREASEGGPSRFFPSFEEMMVLYGPRARLKHRLLGDSGIPSLHECPKASRTMMPLVDLVLPEEHGHVLDPWMGTGAIGEATRLLGHSYTGIEISSQWVEEAKIRLSQRPQSYL